jgi:hypothetical protein
MAQAGRSWVRFPMRSLDLLITYPSSNTMALGSTQSLTEMSTRNLAGGVKGGRVERKADNLTAICELSVYKIWKPRHRAYI